jgi:hypothetical protein
LALLAVLAPAPSPAGQLDLQAGGYVPFEPEERDTWALSPYFGVGLSGQVGRTNLHAFVEGGWIWLDTDYGDFEPDLEDDRPAALAASKPRALEYHVFPVTVGFRVDLNREHELRRPLRLFLGAGFSTIFVHAPTPGGISETVPTYGAVLEIRPEYRAPGGLTLWVAQRVTIAAAARFDRVADLELSGATLCGGLGFRW